MIENVAGTPTFGAFAILAAFWLESAMVIWLTDVLLKMSVARFLASLGVAINKLRNNAVNAISALNFICKFYQANLKAKLGSLSP